MTNYQTPDPFSDTQPTHPPVIPATPDDLQEFITAHAIAALLHRDIGATPTVPAAAQAWGVHPDQIVKTLLFVIEQPASQNAHSDPLTAVVISHGERRIDKRALGEYFGVGRKRVKLATPHVVLTLLGYPAGGVPPFGHRTARPVLLDASLLALQAQANAAQGHHPAPTRVFAGGGDDRTMLEVSLEELLRVTRPTVLPLSEGASTGYSE